MAGWNLKAGAITEYVVSEDRICLILYSQMLARRETHINLD